MLGCAKFESVSRFRTSFDELRNYLRVYATDTEHVPPDGRRKFFTEQVVDSNDRIVSLNTGTDHVFRSAGSYGERRVLTEL